MTTLCVIGMCIKALWIGVLALAVLILWRVFQIVSVFLRLIKRLDAWTDVSQWAGIIKALFNRQKKN